jgi:hypothetical protein
MSIALALTEWEKEPDGQRRWAGVSYGYGVNPTAIRAIEAMVAPVVLITAAAILTGGVLTIFGSVNDRMRAMTTERLGLLVGPDGALRSVSDLPPGTRERISEIDEQLPMLLGRHNLLRIAVLNIYIGIAFLVASVIMLAIAVPTSSEDVGYSSLALVLAGTVALLAGCLFAAISIVTSQDAIDYEVNRSLSLGS